MWKKAISTFCEWKGRATYWTVDTGSARVERGAWSYPDPTGRFAFAGSQDYSVWRFDVESGAKTQLADADAWVRGIAFDRDGTTLVTGGYDGRLIWWPVGGEKPKPIRTIDAHQGWIRAIAVSPDGTLLASGGNDLVVRLWNMLDGKLIREMAGHESHIYNVQFHPDGSQLATGDLKCTPCSVILRIAPSE